MTGCIIKASTTETEPPRSVVLRGSERFWFWDLLGASKSCFPPGPLSQMCVRHEKNSSSCGSRHVKTRFRPFSSFSLSRFRPTHVWQSILFFLAALTPMTPAQRPGASAFGGALAKASRTRSNVPSERPRRGRLPGRRVQLRPDRRQSDLVLGMVRPLPAGRPGLQVWTHLLNQ